MMMQARFQPPTMQNIEQLEYNTEAARENLGASLERIDLVLSKLDHITIALKLAEAENVIDKKSLLLLEMDKLSDASEIKKYVHR
jgi:hypothetical protein